MIWTLCPKKKNHGLRTVETAVAVAVSVFNDRCTSLMAILHLMDIQPGHFCRSFCEETDVFRIKMHNVMLNWLPRSFARLGGNSHWVLKSRRQLERVIHIKLGDFSCLQVRHIFLFCTSKVCQKRTGAYTLIHLFSLIMNRFSPNFAHKLPDVVPLE